MRPPAHRSFPYQFALTALGFVSVLACIPPEPRPTPVVVVPVASANAGGLSSSPIEDGAAPRPPRHMWTWTTDARDARAHARRERLPLVVYVRADWSAGALEMDRNVWSDPRILFHPLALVPLRIDVTGGPDAELWAEELRVQALPTTIFFDGDGHEAMRLEGVRSIDDVLSALRQLGDDPQDR